MSNEQQCKVCGGQTFVKGKLSGYANVAPVNRIFGNSPLLLTFCKECGEVSSMKVKKPKKF